MMFRADLHIHSSYSDGTLEPKEIVDLAKEKGLSAISITDHDSIEAYYSGIIEYANAQEIQLCSGVEFSCHEGETSVHVLAYDFDIHSLEIKDLCKRHRSRRNERNLAILDKLSKKGIIISEDELFSYPNIKVIGRPHIASILKEKGIVKTFDQAFKEYIGDGKSCFVAGPAFSVSETVDIIHEAKGKAFIAHPHLIKRNRVLRNLLKLPVDGLECYYGILPKTAEQKWLDLANDSNLLISGGSDFHGELKPYIPLGASWVDEENYKMIQTNSWITTTP